MKKLTLILTIIFLQSCTNKYAPYYYVNGGYSEKETKKDLYLVKYNSWHLIDYVKTTNLALLRSSQIAIDKGVNYFEANPFGMSSKANYNRTTKVRNEIDREISILVNLNPKNKNSEIVFNSQALCKILLEKEYNKEDFTNEINCGNEAKKYEIEKTKKQLESYHQNFERIIQGTYLPK